MNKRNWSLDSLVLIFSFIVLAQLLSYVVPHGEFERAPLPDQPDRMAVVAGTYEALGPEQRVELPPWHFLLAISDGFSSAQGIIFLIFLVGGVIAVLRKTGAIDAALHGAVERLGKSPWILIGGCLLLFSIGSYTIGMGEEYVPLVPIIVTMSLAMRMDAVVAMGMVWIPYGIGWACAGINPFGVLIAQDIAQVPLTSGWALKLLMMFGFLAVAFHHIYRYAMRVKADPSQSLVADVDYSTGFEPPADARMTLPRVLTLVIFVAGLVLFVYGVKVYGWYIPELNAIFLGIGLVAAIVAGLSASDTSRTFLEGAAAMTPAALLVGFARSIETVLSDGQIIDTVVHSIAGLLEGLPSEASALGMLVVQSICNLFIPSGSGQAFVTMPIMSPLATLTDVPQQTAVLAYQFGDGFSNMLVPTSALVMGALALGKVPYTAWFRFAGPLLLKLLGLSAVFLVLSMHVGEAFGF
ncbi:MAG: Na+/H+ antiporter NhaC family protein [Woeseiaceae bacterium]|nr:Na+/H+ antiporter NhaC family protein [Woeseiaceae bacterium]